MSKHIWFITAMLVGSIVFLFIMQFRFSATIDASAQSQKKFMIKQTIASDLIDMITQVESLTYKIPLTSTNSKILEVYLRNFDQRILEIRDLISFLETGGIYTKKITLNITGHDSYSRTFQLDKPDSLPIEVIRLKPQITRIVTFVDRLKKLTLQRLDALASQNSVEKLGREIMLLTKSSNSVFRRMKEDANQLYYDAHKKKLTQDKLISVRKKRYNFVTFATIFLIIVFLSMVLRYFIQEL